MTPGNAPWPCTPPPRPSIWQVSSAATESGELGSAVNAYIERIRADRNIVPCFDSFYEYLRDDYRRELEEREIRVSREDFNIDNISGQFCCFGEHRKRW